MLKRIVSGLGFALLLGTAPAVAQSGLYFNPQITPALTGPTFFEGLYAGVQFGLMNSNKQVFYANTNTYRVPAGGMAGYNMQLTPWLVAGVEAQAEATLDWTTGTGGYNGFVLARMGLLTRDDFMLYHFAGLGVIDGRSAYAIGVGGEQALSDNFSVRGDILSFGQLSAPAGVTHYGGIMGMKITAGALWHIRDGGGVVQNGPSAFGATPTDFRGPYLGVYAGSAVDPPVNFFVGNTTYGWHLSRFAQGAIAGWTYDLGSSFRVGAEVQGGITYNTSGNIGLDGEVLARLGLVPAKGWMVYASGGLGVLENRPAYAFGGGVEYALWGRNSVRLDVQMLGEINPAPPINAAGITATKVTLGSLWHFN